jgi:cytochrome c553
MGPIAAALSPEAMEELAHLYSEIDASRLSVSASPDAAAIERGREIALHGIRAQRVPRCVACHGPDPIVRNLHYPTLAGQYGEYLELQLTLFKQGQRGGTARAHLMRRAAAGLTPPQMRDVALYFASLPTEPRSPAKEGR